MLDPITLAIFAVLVLLFISTYIAERMHHL